jgi:hypothetical protein
MSRMFVVVVMAMWMIEAPARGADVAAPSFEITLRKQADRVKTSGEADRVVFTVTSPSGIGGATIAPKTGKWPQAVIVRLELKGLESLTVSNGKTTLSASVSSHGDGRVLLQLVEPGKEKPVDSKSPYWTEIRVLDAKGKPAKQIPLRDGCFELTVPKAFFGDGAKSLALSWIDYFRG